MPDEEMKKAREFLGVNGNGDYLRYSQSHQLGLIGCINSNELKAGLERVGIHLAPWEVHCAVAKGFRRCHALCFLILCVSAVRNDGSC